MIRFAVAGATFGLARKASDTVATETPLSAAMARRDGGFGGVSEERRAMVRKVYVVKSWHETARVSNVLDHGALVFRHRPWHWMLAMKISDAPSRGPLSLLAAAVFAALFTPVAVAAGQTDAAPAAEARPLPVNPEVYELVFEDDFEGDAIDASLWEHRHLGPWAAKSRTAVEEAAYLDGRGNLVLAWASRPWADPENRAYDTEFERLYAVLKSKKEWKYGYFEMRVKMPIVKGAGLAVWSRSQQLPKANATDAARFGAEIDLIEQTFWGRHGKPEDWKTATVHWGGYGKHHEKAGFIVKEPDFRDGEWHTVGLLWTPDAYRFFYDRKPVGNLTVGVSRVPQFFLLHMRQFATHLVKGVGWGDLEETDAKAKIDWFRVYQPREGASVEPLDTEELLYQNMRLISEGAIKYKAREKTRSELENRE